MLSKKIFTSRRVMASNDTLNLDHSKSKYTYNKVAIIWQFVVSDEYLYSGNISNLIKLI